MDPLRRIAAVTALSTALLVAGAGDVPAASAASAGIVPVRPADLDGGNLDGDGVTIMTEHGAPPGLGSAALAFSLDGVGEAGSDSMFGDAVDEASINVAPDRALPVHTLDRLSYWTYQPSRAAAHDGLVPVLQVRLVPHSGHGHLTPAGHKVLQFTPSDNAALQGPIRARRWQRWNAVRRGRARWRVLETGLHAPGIADADRSDPTRTEEHHRCDRHDCTITWHDVRDAFDGLVIAEVRLVLTQGGAVPPASARAGAADTPSSARDDVTMADGLSINRATYDFAGAPRRARTMLARSAPARWDGGFHAQASSDPGPGSTSMSVARIGRSHTAQCSSTWLISPQA